MCHGIPSLPSFVSKDMCQLLFAAHRQLKINIPAKAPECVKVSV
jgi:hypothetical protein